MRKGGAGPAPTTRLSGSLVEAAPVPPGKCAGETPAPQEVVLVLSSERDEVCGFGMLCP